jgi:hypothetical protein
VSKKSKYITVKAEPFSAQIQRRPLDWPTPMRDLLLTPENGDITWRRLQYAFRLPNPHAFPPLGVAWTSEQRETLSRYVSHAETLARTSLLGASDSMTVNIADDNTGEEIETKFSAPDGETEVGERAIAVEVGYSAAPTALSAAPGSS